MNKDKCEMIKWIKDNGKKEEQRIERNDEGGVRNKQW